MVLTHSAGRVAPGSEFLRCQPAVPDDSYPSPSSQGVHQLPRTTHNPVRVAAVSPAVLDNSGPGPSARGVEQLSRATQAHVQGLAGSTRCPGRLTPGSKGPWIRPEFPGISGPVPNARRVDLLSRMPRAHVRNPAVSTRFPDQIRPCPRPRDRSDVPGEWPHVKGTAGSTSCAGRICPVLVGLRCQQAVPDDWGSFPRSQCRPAVPGDSGSGSDACGVDQMSLASPARVRGGVGSKCSPG